ncbi:cohesin domain-containing protein [Paenibacillus pini]|uniref:Dockerin domain-containing protein n=1 Tax=Paenibacillus pini JCM 16418 TaxID=1236976 RepID=W7Z3D1_9BACL|nr:cohesin domain-containing protein [Paenibacillus pini]GAF08994.1 hypothetical protein JCM16418_3107 [Paenibacillus pini JCM 16418]
MMTIRLEKKWTALFMALLLAAWICISASQVHADTSDEGAGAQPSEQSQIEPKASAAADAGQQSVTLKASVTQVKPGETFTVKYGFAGIVSNVYAQDITIEYDPAVLEVVADSIKSLKDGVTIVNDPATQTAGKLRVILASMGADHPVTGTGDILEIGFKAASVSKTTDSAVSITQVTLSNAQGEEFNLSGTSVKIKVTTGTTASGDVNGDGKVSIGDLAMIAAKYGLTSASSNWNEVKHLDLDGNGAIDIADMSIVAKKIIEQP